MKAKERMNERIYQHGENLNRIFNLNEDPDKLARRIHRLEVKAHKLATDYCNGENGVTTGNWDEKTEPILKAVRKILNCTDSFPIFINGDARGYALKIRSEYMKKCSHINGYKELHKDWGGYGILAPEFDGKL